VGEKKVIDLVYAEGKNIRTTRIRTFLQDLESRAFFSNVFLAEEWVGISKACKICANLSCSKISSL